MTTWRIEIQGELEEHSETWADVEAVTLTEFELDVQFHDGFGRAEGKAFTAWTRHRVYFPALYDGSEWVASVARHPDGKPTAHIGGG